MVDTFTPRYTNTKQRTVHSLRTKSPARAKHSAKALMARLEGYWLNLRLKEAQILAAHLLRHAPSQKILIQHSTLTLPNVSSGLKIEQKDRSMRAKKI